MTCLFSYHIFLSLSLCVFVNLFFHTATVSSLLWYWHQYHESLYVLSFWLFLSINSIQNKINSIKVRAFNRVLPLQTWLIYQYSLNYNENHLNRGQKILNIPTVWQRAGTKRIDCNLKWPNLLNHHHYHRVTIQLQNVPIHCNNTAIHVSKYYWQHCQPFHFELTMSCM